MASHLAAEFVNKYEKERRPLPAIALTTDTAVITSIANDTAFHYVFSRQIDALGSKGDILIVFTTRKQTDLGQSMHSMNLAKAMQMAEIKEIEIILAPVEGDTTAGRQENQLIWLHKVSKEVELAFI